MTVQTGSVRAAARAGGPSGTRGTQFRVLMGALAAAAWLALGLWSGSPYGRYLDHGRWTDAGVLAALCRVVPDGDIVVPALLHAAGWVLMIAAMMLPTTLPILERFRRMTGERPDGRRLLALVVAGYVVAWLGFGLVAHAADWGVHAAGARLPWLALNGWVLGASILALAGAFQFSALKYRCLEKCHTPFGFIIARWHGTRPAREALRLGFDHGLFCVGCCWALMLLMFVVGTGNLGWMLVLAAVMAAEKNLPGGQRLRTPLGVGLLAWAAGIVAVNLA
jgi:predicted metal-binding membrane protein